MFTLKFMQFFEEGGHIEDCVRCPHYEARKTSDGCYIITTYQDFCNVDGVERRIAAHPEEKPVNTYFACCYVENENGSTIGHYTYDK